MTKTLSMLVLGVCAWVLCQAEAAAIDWTTTYVASVAEGLYHREPPGWRLLPYKDRIYFSTRNGGTSSVLRYDPADGLSNGMNHTILTTTTGTFTTMREMGGTLYMADDRGGLQTFDGVSVAAMTGTPFSPTNFVDGMVEFNGMAYFGTSTGSIYELGGTTFTPVYISTPPRRVADLAVWNGSLYASFYAGDSDGYVAKSNGSDLTAWSQVGPTGVCGSEIMLGTPEHLYLTPTNSAAGHVSTVWRSGDGTTFEQIAGPGPFKFPLGNPFWHDGTAYIFENGVAHDYNGGFLVTDDGSTTTVTSMSDWPYRICSATELNGRIYAIGLDHGYNEPGNVYLLSPVPEPSSLALLAAALLGGLAFWWRRRTTCSAK